MPSSSYKWGSVTTYDQAYSILKPRIRVFNTKGELEERNATRVIWNLILQPDVSPSFRDLRYVSKQEFLDLLNPFTETLISAEQMDALLFIQDHVRLLFCTHRNRAVSAIPEGWEFCDEVLFKETGRPAQRRYATPPPHVKEFEEWLVVKQLRCGLIGGGAERDIGEIELLELINQYMASPPSLDRLASFLEYFNQAGKLFRLYVYLFLSLQRLPAKQTPAQI